MAGRRGVRGIVGGSKANSDTLPQGEECHFTEWAGWTFFVCMCVYPNSVRQHPWKFPSSGWKHEAVSTVLQTYHADTWNSLYWETAAGNNCTNSLVLGHCLGALVAPESLQGAQNLVITWLYTLHVAFVLRACHRTCEIVVLEEEGWKCS